MAAEERKPGRLGESFAALFGHAEYQRLIALGKEAPPEEVDLACPRCKGAGWLRMDVDPGHQDFGQIVECRCGLVARRKAEQLFGRSKIPAEYADLGLDTYPDRGIAADVVDWWHERPHPWLLLAGDLGVGKTGLTIGLVKRAISEGKSALFRPMVDLLSDIRATYRSRDAATPDEAALMTGCKTIDVLALDDIGAERMTGWAQERIFEIVNHRYNERRPTVMTSNLGRDDLYDHLGERIFDRINGMSYVYVIEGSNLRRAAS